MCSRVICVSHNATSSFSLDYDEHHHCQRGTPRYLFLHHPVRLLYAIREKKRSGTSLSEPGKDLAKTPDIPKDSVSQFGLIFFFGK